MTIKVRAAPPERPGDWPTGRRLVDRSLSYRELQVGAEIANGMSNGEVGHILGIKGKTVKSHLQRISDVTGTSGRVSLAVHLVRSGEVLFCGACDRFVAPHFHGVPGNSTVCAGHCPSCDKMLTVDP